MGSSGVMWKLQAIFALLAAVVPLNALAVSDSQVSRPLEVGVVGDTVRVFPEVSGRNLEGREFRLPNDFEGRANLVLIAFQRDHQALVDTWMPAAAALSESLPDFRYYELPTIGSGYKLFRGFIDGGMRSGIPDREARERTITLYLDKDDFRGALGLASDETIYVLVLDASGKVALIVEGVHSVEKGANVREAIEELLGAGASEAVEPQAPN
jgi:hypothetical protein